VALAGSLRACASPCVGAKGKLVMGSENFEQEPIWLDELRAAQLQRSPQRLLTAFLKKEE